MTKLSFSGHEKFHCRQFWLKKGYDFLQSGKKFSDDDAVVALGVGKNMVASIRYWMKAFDLVDESEQPNEFAHTLFAETGKDPYLEDEGTMWLLHYRLVTAGKASLYNLFFNEFRKERFEFTKEQLLNFLKRKCEESGTTVSPTSLNADIDVFLKTYLRPKNQSKNIEDDFSGLLFESDVLQKLDKSGSELWYLAEGKERETIPAEILLYAILDREAGNVSISLHKLLNESNSVGMVFAFHENGLMSKIQDILAHYPEIIFSDDAGVRELQLKKPLDKQTVLMNYYDN